MKSPAPICEACWVEQNSSWEPHSMDNQGNILMRLKDVQVPNKYNTGTVEICRTCNKVTIAGIYEMVTKDVTFGFGSFAEMLDVEDEDSD